jgi:hypothetical protein
MCRRGINLDRSTTKKLLLGVAAVLSMVSVSDAGSLLTKEQARDKAVELLVGWQWGHTKAQALRHIKRIDFLAHGYVEPGEGGNHCNNPTWKFTIAKDRYLYIDATTGEDCIVVGLIPD